MAVAAEKEVNGATQLDVDFGASGDNTDGGVGVVSYTAEQEARVVKKMDWNLMSLLFVLYMLAFLDRGNIGNARIAGMATDLKLDTNRYNWLLNIFYIAYVTTEFDVLLWKLFPPHIVCACVVFLWGLFATVCAAANTWDAMMPLRFFLGFAEAAYAPGIIYLLSFFYLRHEIGFRIGIFASAAPLASTFSGALAYGITSGTNLAIANWRLLFLVEGLPTILMAAVAFFFIPDSPDTARFLNEEDKAIVRARVHRQVGGTSGRDRVGSFSLRDALPAVVDPKVWLCGLMYFCGNVSYASLPAFLPTILQQMGYTAVKAQGLSAPPSFAAFLFALLTTWMADRTQQRCFVLWTTSMIGAIGYVLLATVDTVGVRYFATFLASAGVFATIPNILALILNNQGSDARRGMAIVMINLIGQCGPFLGNNSFPISESPRYVRGMAICSAFMFFSAKLAIIQRIYLRWENRKLEAKYASESKGEAVAVENYGPQFRNVL